MHKNPDKTWCVTFTRDDIKELVDILHGMGFTEDTSASRWMVMLGLDSVAHSMLYGAEKELFFEDQFGLANFIDEIVFDSMEQNVIEEAKGERSMVSDVRTWVDRKRADRVEVVNPFTCDDGPEIVEGESGNVTRLAPYTE